jgi:hypothetical protein
LETLGVDGRIVLNGSSRSVMGAWTIDLTQDRDGWRDLVNAVTNYRVS